MLSLIMVGDATVPPSWAVGAPVTGDPAVAVDAAAAIATATTATGSATTALLTGGRRRPV
ncbi:hypothetical protein CFP66_03340 [Pseudonocardia sp. MH-G8]|nr:hypothetical protein CFP66_03340 [Pseudonocardia sp. MH-G8]